MHRAAGGHRSEAAGPEEIDDQAEVFAFLGDAASHRLDKPVLRIDTHCASVFLAGTNVYKVKRAVRYPFLDFSTLEKRRAACLAEMDVNRENAPDLYLGIIPITRQDGRLHLGGDGEVVEWAVHLRRFDENATLDRLAAQGPLDDALMDRLARRILAAHARAPRGDHLVATARLRAIMEESLAELRESPDLFPPEGTEIFAGDMIAAFEQAESLLLRRSAHGQVRRCHGDLHLGNIVLIEGEPVLFDAIEFDDDIATSDILYDLAFVLMDLWERGLRANANRLFNRYLILCEDRTAQIEGLEALPLFLALRATIRAKVLATLSRADPQHEGHRVRARAYFDAACGFIAPAEARLVAVGGLSGSGKTVLSAAIAPFLGRAPGALHLRSDIERKIIFGVEETTRLAPAAYQHAVTRQVYSRLHELAQKAIRTGQAAVIDATHHHIEDRDGASTLAMVLGVPFIGIWLDAPAAVLTSRVARRVGDASDATPDIVAKQLHKHLGQIRWVRLDAAQPLGPLSHQALQFAKAAQPH